MAVAQEPVEPRDAARLPQQLCPAGIESRPEGLRRLHGGRADRGSGTRYVHSPLHYHELPLCVPPVALADAPHHRRRGPRADGKHGAARLYLDPGQLGDGNGDRRADRGPAAGTVKPGPIGPGHQGQAAWPTNSCGA
ncbi:hypothetical protein G6F31_018167 [Rhizopus arrhizus]|nr:hypothetical protein G6F31_018167 [Rhizopus arrhizus]